MTGVQTCALPICELRGNREELGREREVAARGRRGEVGLGFAAPWGSCRGREQVGRGPATVVARRATLGFRRGATVTKDGVGPGGQREKRERARGWAARALRG